MKKIDRVIEIINGIDLNWYVVELDLLLENNYGQKVQQDYADLQEKSLKKLEIKRVRQHILKASFDVIKYLVNAEIEVSDSTILKALKIVGYEKFNEKIIETINVYASNSDYFEKIIRGGK